MDYIVILVTTASSEQAEAIARELLAKKLAACCNIISGVRSFYWWQGKIVDDNECLMVIKSRANMFEKIKETVKVLHTYTVPEIIALPLTAGDEPYLTWIDQSLSA